MDTFWTEQKLKVHRFTNNLQGLQKVMVKDFPWNIIPWNALLFEKTFKQLSILDIENNGFIFYVMTPRNVRKQGLVFPLFSPDSDDRLSLNFHRFVILYIIVIHEVWALDNTVNRCCAIALKKMWWIMFYNKLNFEPRFSQFHSLAPLGSSTFTTFQPKVVQI